MSGYRWPGTAETLPKKLMPEKLLVAKPDGALALVESISKGQSIILSPAALTEALMRTVESYSPRKVDALKLGARIVKVTDNETLADAKEAQGKLAGVRIDAEKARKEFTQGFLDSQRFIKENFDSLSVGIVREEKRLADLVQTYAREVEQKRQAQIAEQQRQQAEAARKAKEAQDEIDRLAALAKEKPSEELEEALEEATFQAEVAALAPAPVVEIAEAVGKAVLDFALEHEGTRHEAQDILAFAKLYPHMCKIEIRRSAVIEELNNGACFGAEPGTIPSVPGLRIFEKFRTSNRVTR